MHRRLIAVLPGALAIAACADDPGDPGVGAPARVVIEGATGVLAVGDSVALRARVVDAGGRAVDAAAVTWHSLAPGIAVIDANGRLRGWEAGATAVVARAGQAADTIPVRVEVQPREIGVEIVSSGSPAGRLWVGGMYGVHARVLDGRGRQLVPATFRYTVTDTAILGPPASSSPGSPPYGRVRAVGTTTLVVESAGLRVERTIVTHPWGTP